MQKLLRPLLLPFLAHPIILFLMRHSQPPLLLHHLIDLLHLVRLMRYQLGLIQRLLPLLSLPLLLHLMLVLLLHLSSLSHLSPLLVLTSFLHLSPLRAPK
jgi:hypothetical protein